MGLKIDARTDNGDSVLHETSLYGHEDLVREIIRLEPSLVNCKSKNSKHYNIIILYLTRFKSMAFLPDLE